jgi:hypothetical protein
MHSFLTYIRKFLLLFVVFYSFFAIKAENDANKKALDYQMERLTKKVDLPVDKETCEKMALCAVVSGEKLEQPCAELLGKFLNSSRSGQDEYLNKCETILKEAELDKNKDN